MSPVYSASFFTTYIGTALGGCLFYTMPSLRRTVSNPPVVRSSPYSTAVLSARGGGHRRSSGSDTSTRRVLADIDWWKVTEGQCDSTFEEDRNRGVADLPQLEVTLGLGIPVTHVDEGVDHLSSLPSFPTTANGSVEVNICARSVEDAR